MSVMRVRVEGQDQLLVGDVLTIAVRLERTVRGYVRDGLFSMSELRSRLSDAVEADPLPIEQDSLSALPAKDDVPLLFVALTCGRMHARVFTRADVAALPPAFRELADEYTREYVAMARAGLL